MHNIESLLRLEFMHHCDGKISARAFRKARDLLTDIFDTKYQNIEPVLAEVGTDWEVTDKESVPCKITGTWPKRVANHLYKRLGYRLSDEQKALLGENARRGIQQGDFFFTIVNKIDWNAGDFGDGGSCFWSSHASCRNIITRNGGGAVLVYKNGAGVSRCWILPLDPQGYVIFNAYGSLSLESFADALSIHLPGCYIPYQIDLTENGEWRGEFWINGGKGIVLPLINCAPVSAIDLHLRRPLHCANCGDHIEEPDAYALNIGTFCGECYHTFIARCENCGQEFFRRHHSQTLCPDCRDLFSVCSECGRKVKISDAIPEVIYEQIFGTYRPFTRHFHPECHHNLTLRQNDERRTIRINLNELDGRTQHAPDWLMDWGEFLTNLEDDHDHDDTF